MVKVGVLSGPVTGVLGGLLLFLKCDFSMGLLVCLLSLAAIFVVKVGVFAGPVTGLLGGPAAFLEVGFFHGASSLLVVSSCHIFW